ncbi:MAG: hypothetical protein KIT22_12140 [Verrucomicrobiae bacterium]|nr:hypothetical protein [Verrucomicrobiae bacterium]
MPPLAVWMTLYLAVCVALAGSIVRSPRLHLAFEHGSLDSRTAHTHLSGKYRALPPETFAGFADSRSVAVLNRLQGESESHSHGAGPVHTHAGKAGASKSKSSHSSSVPSDAGHSHQGLPETLAEGSVESAATFIAPPAAGLGFEVDSRRPGQARAPHRFFDWIQAARPPPAA